MSALLLEIGTEEIPARFLPDAVSDLRLSSAQDIELEHKIPLSGSITTFGTPRRLALIIKGLPERQEDRVKEVFGPPKKIAYNEDGTLTKAGLKFAESAGISPDKLIIKKKDKGEYVVAVIEEKGAPVCDILPEVLKKIILSLGFPKTMRWGDGSLRFVRPIRWIAALLDKEVIHFEIDGIKSGNLTYGHRFLSQGPVRLEDPGSYVELLRENFVIAGGDERKEIIKKQMSELVRGEGGTFVEDSGLLDTAASLVEYPQAVMGSFDEKYLSLPPELLTVVMKGHQKYFSVRDNRGNLKNQFIAISNTKAENDDTVRKGAERVIRARFEDARFYYEEDIKKPLSERTEELKRVTFYEGLGNLYDKTMRIVRLSGFIADKVFANEIPRNKEEQVNNARRAALLSKADLITGVVREFPELQGIMGAYYAKHDGEDEAVCKAIREQYIFADEDISQMSHAGAILGLADKMDNIAGFFSIGLKPTGSQDPFALRRNALAIITMLVEKKYGLTIKEILEAALSGLRVKDADAVKTEIIDFFEARVENRFIEVRGVSGAAGKHPQDILGSVIHLSTSEPLKNFKKRLAALSAFKNDPLYSPALAALKRVRNIIHREELPAFKAELFKEDAERELGKALSEASKKVLGLEEKRDYDGAIKEISGLAPHVNAFFDAVMVMDKNEEIKANRLALLNEIWKTASVIADFSKLQEQ